MLLVNISDSLWLKHFEIIHFFDQFILSVQAGVDTVFSKPASHRINPAATLEEPALSLEEKQRSRGCMRVNHTGEVCAQALYRGHALMAQAPLIRQMLNHAAAEETDHLGWCHDRLIELGSHRSFLNPFWYCHSFLIGIITGGAGDSWSLGFVEETEKQVGAHLNDHLHQLPTRDHKSRAIVQQMKIDEMQHGATAKNLGAKILPEPIKKIMTVHAKVMTTIAYWI